MDSLSKSEQFKRWSAQSEDFVKIIQALEEENKNLKLKILELETKETNGNNVCVEGQDEQTSEKSKMSGTVMSMSSAEGVNSPLDEIRVKEEPIDELIQNNLRSETLSTDEDMDIDIKDEDVGYGQSNSKQKFDNSTHNPILADPLNGDQSSDIPKHEIERSIQRMSRSTDQVSITEPVSQDFGTELGTGTDCELNQSSSSHSPKNILCQEIVKPQPEVSNQPLNGRKEPCLTTRTPEVHKCETCSAAFETQFKLREHKHNKSHTGEKGSPANLKTPLKCSICKKSFPTERVLANHMKTHTAEKSARSLEVDDKGFSAKRSCTGEKLNPAGQSKKQRKTETENDVYKAEEMPGVRDRIDPPCVDEVERNPLKVEKILGIILSNLGKHDLLNARKVSRAWNDESLKVLRKSKFTQMLRDWKMERYILFATANDPRQFILPFHLDFSISSFSVNLAECRRNLTSHVESLCQTFGPQCVSTLTLTTFDPDLSEENFKEIGLIECLALISPGLQTLDMTNFNLSMDIIKNQKISFPNLKKLICNTSRCRSRRSGPDRTYFSIIENSPKLEDLSLTDTCNLDSWPLKFNQLKFFSLGSMLKPQNILDKILSSGPPVLRELRTRLTIGQTRSAEEEIVVYNILKTVSHTLKSLTFHGDICTLNTENLKFPKLPQLEHFGLEYEIGNRILLDADTIGFSRENFPSLKSIELPIGFISTPSPVQSKEDENVRIEFPNLNKYTLRVSSLVRPEYVYGSLEHLQIFPTPSKLCLVNIGGHGFVNNVLYRIMKSNWSKSIQQIELARFPEYSLGPILNRLEFSPRVDLYLEEKWYQMLEESLKTEFQDTMKRIRMEFEESVVDYPGPISEAAHGHFSNLTILRRVNQSVCQNDK